MTRPRPISPHPHSPTQPAFISRAGSAHPSRTSSLAKRPRPRERRAVQGDGPGFWRADWAHAGPPSAALPSRPSPRGRRLRAPVRRLRPEAGSGPKLRSAGSGPLEPARVFSSPVRPSRAGPEPGRPARARNRIPKGHDGGPPPGRGGCVRVRGGDKTGQGQGRGQNGPASGEGTKRASVGGGDKRASVRGGDKTGKRQGTGQNGPASGKGTKLASVRGGDKTGQRQGRGQNGPASGKGGEACVDVALTAAAGERTAGTRGRPAAAERRRQRCLSESLFD